MGKMSEVYRLYLEEKRYEKDLNEDTWLQRVAYSKNMDKKKPIKPTTDKK